MATGGARTHDAPAPAESTKNAVNGCLRLSHMLGSTGPGDGSDEAAIRWMEDAVVSRPAPPDEARA